MSNLSRKPIMALFLLSIASILVAACGASPTAVPVPTMGGGATETPVASQPTVTLAPSPTTTSPPPATATSTPAPTATQPPSPTWTATTLPTVTPLPTTPPTAAPSPTPTPIRISFAPGATSAVVEGNLAAHGAQTYVLGAVANQLLDVSVTPGSGIRLSIYGVDGTVLMSGMGEGAFFRGTLPSTQDYILALSAGDAATAYTMNVVIPARISFAPGATSAVVEGSLAAHGAQYYILGAAASQLLDVSVTPDTAVRLSIYGVDGTVLMSGMGEGAFFRGTLPSSQDYILALSAGDAATAYTVNVVIPERISFAPGAISATLEGNLPAFGSHSYILGASAGQEMEVNVTPEGNVRLSIYGVDGTVLMSGMGEGSSFTGTLPSTQDYILDLFAGDHAVAYTLQVTIP